MISASSSAGGEAVNVFASIAEHTDPVGQQGQIGHCGREVQLEFRLDSPEVAGLPDAQLLQAGQAMLGHHPPAPVLVLVGALLQRPSLLKQGFLGMDQHLPALPSFGRNALGPQRTRPAHRRLKPEGPQAMGRTGAIGPFPGWDDGAGDLSRRTGAGASHQVDDEVILVEVFAVGSSRHSGHQLATGVDKLLRVPPSP